MFRLLSLAVFAAFVFQIYAIINPMNLESTVIRGVCRVTAISWLQDKCERDPAYFHYYPLLLISGEFVNLPGSPAVETGTSFAANESVIVASFDHLSVNKFRVDGKHGRGPNKQAFLFDDMSGSPLVNCSNSSIVSLKKQLVSFLPHLTSALNTTSLTIHYPAYFPLNYFNCSHDTMDSKTYLSFQKVDKLFLIPFFATIAFLIFCLYLVQKYDVDGPIKDLAAFFLQIVFLIVFAVNFLFYVVYVILGHIVCNLDVMDPETFLRKGSIFLPLVWFYKKLRKSCDDSQPESPISSDVTPVEPDTTVIESPAFFRRSSAPEMNPRPHVPPNRSFTPPAAQPDTPPLHQPARTQDTSNQPMRPQVRALSPPAYNLNSDDLSPPSYEEVVQNYSHYL